MAEALEADKEAPRTPRCAGLLEAMRPTDTWML